MATKWAQMSKPWTPKTLNVQKWTPNVKIYPQSRGLPWKILHWISDYKFLGVFLWRDCHFILGLQNSPWLRYMFIFHPYILSGSFHKQHESNYHQERNVCIGQIGLFCRTDCRNGKAARTCWIITLCNCNPPHRSAEMGQQYKIGRGNYWTKCASGAKRQHRKLLWKQSVQVAK